MTVFVLGGHQTDFKRHWTREGKQLVDLMREAVQSGLDSARTRPDELQVAHVGNFAAELFVGQGHLGGLFIEAAPQIAGLPCSRHEAACASGSAAVLAALADLESGRYDVAAVLGVELMRNVRAYDGQRMLAAAAWVPVETEGREYPWASLFSEVGDAYAERYGLQRDHLAALARQMFDNARANPNAQTRDWVLDDESFADDDEKNPLIAGRIRRHDCSQITDGAALVVLASERFAADWAARAGVSLDAQPRILGWGHRTARMSLADKLEASRDADVLFPHVKGTVDDALKRAGLENAWSLDAIEAHDCFSTTAYMTIDHFGLTPPGECFRAVEDGVLARDGKLPLNPSGGLMGLGHPVGATGVRMVLDAYKQTTQTAGAYQVEGARRVGTLNLGGSTTTSVSFVVGTDG
jgi:acetyl-CoA C-acetyltransferase